MSSRSSTLAAKRHKRLERQDFIGAYVVELRQRRSGEEENINAAINVGVKSGGLSIWDQLEIHDDFEWISDI